MMNKDELINSLVDAVMSVQEQHIEEMDHNFSNPPDGKPPQKYVIGETVKVNGWTGSTEAVITGVEWIFHHRCAEWCWGYSVDRQTGLTFRFIPEGYLRKL